MTRYPGKEHVALLGSKHCKGTKLCHSFPCQSSIIASVLSLHERWPELGLCSLSYLCFAHSIVTFTVFHIVSSLAYQTNIATPATAPDAGKTDSCTSTGLAYWLPLPFDLIPRHPLSSNTAGVGFSLRLLRQRWCLLLHQRDLRRDDVNHSVTPLPGSTISLPPLLYNQTPTRL